MPEYINPNNHTVYLTGQDGLSLSIAPHAMVMLPEYFERYCSKGFIRRVRQHQARAQVSISPHRRIQTGPAKPVQKQPAKQITESQPSAQPRSLHLQSQEAAKQQTHAVLKLKPEIKHKRIVGRQLPDDPNPLLAEALKSSCYPISNNIGVGILSYNRPLSLRRLIESIRCHTDLRRTTIFISDDGSTNQELLDYLSELERDHDFIVLRGPRLGVAGNTNRLLRCLARFEHGLLLNDDVEVKSQGWDILYREAANRTGLHHFCMRQPGVYGAKPGDMIQRGGITLSVVTDKPQGAVLYFDRCVLDTIGYFDESIFGLYGMEHVDWSERAQQVNGAPGYFDVISSSDYFVIHADESAVKDRQQALAHGRAVYANRHPGRGLIKPGQASVVPKISCVIPCRNQGRATCIEVVIAGIRAQRFPDIEIIVAEHDIASHIQDTAKPFKHVLVTTAAAGPFNKARVFNAGVAQATADKVILHDADMLTQSGYVAAVSKVLDEHDACHLGKTVIYLSRQATGQVQAWSVLEQTAACDRAIGYFEGGSLACRRQTYWRVGGFNQEFVGYGVEDCEFYARLVAGATSWLEARSFPFVHLWHGRSEGWEIHHERNRDLGRRLNALPMAQRLYEQCERLRNDGYGGQVDDARRQP